MTAHRPTLRPKVSWHLHDLRDRCSITAGVNQVRAVVDSIRILAYRGMIAEDQILSITPDQVIELARMIPPDVRHIGDAIRKGCVPMTLYAVTRSQEDSLV